MKKFFSPGKVILSGEHSVVHGEPALVSSIDLGIEAFIENDADSQKKSDYLNQILEILRKRVLSSQKLAESDLQKIDLDSLSIFVNSNLPQKSGLGSSAAFAHAVFLCLLDHFKIKLSKKEIFQLVFEAENYIHGTSSGVDPSAVVFGGLQVFQKKSKTKFQRKRLKSTLQLNFTLINSGEALESTGELITFVKSKLGFEKTIKKMGEVTSKFIKSLGENKFDYSLITENQRLLEDLGVVGEKAKRLVREIENLGGFAKITGAGGIKNGSGWLLVYHPNEKFLDNFVLEKGLETHKIRLNK